MSVSGCVEYLNGFINDFKDINVFVDFKGRLPKNGKEAFVGDWLNTFKEYVFVYDEKKSDKYVFNYKLCDVETKKQIEFDFEGERYPVEITVKFINLMKFYCKYLTKSDNLMEALNLKFPENVISVVDFPTLYGSALTYDQMKDEFNFFVITETHRDFKNFIYCKKQITMILEYLYRYNEFLDENDNLIVPCLNRRRHPFHRIDLPEFNISFHFRKLTLKEPKNLLDRVGVANNFLYQTSFKDWLGNFLHNEITENVKKEIFDSEDEFIYFFNKLVFKSSFFNQIEKKPFELRKKRKNDSVKYSC